MAVVALLVHACVADPHIARRLGRTAFLQDSPFDGTLMLRDAAARGHAALASTTSVTCDALRQSSGADERPSNCSEQRYLAEVAERPNAPWQAVLEKTSRTEPLGLPQVSMPQAPSARRFCAPQPQSSMVLAETRVMLAREPRDASAPDAFVMGFQRQHNLFHLLNGVLFCAYAQLAQRAPAHAHAHARRAASGAAGPAAGGGTNASLAGAPVLILVYGDAEELKGARLAMHEALVAALTVPGSARVITAFELERAADAEAARQRADAHCPGRRRRLADRGVRGVVRDVVVPVRHVVGAAEPAPHMARVRFRTTLAGACAAASAAAVPTAGRAARAEGARAEGAPRLHTAAVRTLVSAQHAGFRLTPMYRYLLAMPVPVLAGEYADLAPAVRAGLRLHGRASAADGPPVVVLLQRARGRRLLDVRTGTERALVADMCAAGVSPRVVTLDDSLTLRAQVAALADAAVLVSAHGAQLTHALWMPRGGSVLEVILRRGWCCQFMPAWAQGAGARQCVTPCVAYYKADYATLVRALGLRWLYVDAHSLSPPSDSSPFVKLARVYACGRQLGRVAAVLAHEQRWARRELGREWTEQAAEQLEPPGLSAELLAWRYVLPSLDGRGAAAGAVRVREVSDFSHQASARDATPRARAPAAAVFSTPVGRPPKIACTHYMDRCFLQTPPKRATERTGPLASLRRNKRKFIAEPLLPEQPGWVPAGGPNGTLLRTTPAERLPLDAACNLSAALERIGLRITDESIVNGTTAPD